MKTLQQIRAERRAVQGRIKRLELELAILSKPPTPEERQATRAACRRMAIEALKMLRLPV